MKRNIDPDFEFNKARFAETLSKAIGVRSAAMFAREAEISTSYLSRYMNQKVDVTPTIATLRKIANAAVGVGYKDLLEAAGYDASKYDEEDLAILAAKQGIVWSPINALMPSLCRSGFDWTISSPTEEGGPISVTVERAPFEKWFFIPVMKEMVSKEDISAVLGSKEAEVITPGSKVTFLTLEKSVFEALSLMEMSLLSLRLSVAFVNTDGIVSEERMIKSAVSTDKNDEEFVLSNRKEIILSLLSV